MSSYEEDICAEMRSGQDDCPECGHESVFWIWSHEGVEDPCPMCGWTQELEWERAKEIVDGSYAIVETERSLMPGRI